jgi:hypothetical protein
VCNKNQGVLGSKKRCVLVGWFNIPLSSVRHATGPCLIRISKSNCSKENDSTIAFHSCWHVLRSPPSHRFVKFVEFAVNMM